MSTHSLDVHIVRSGDRLVLNPSPSMFLVSDGNRLIAGYEKNRTWAPRLNDRVTRTNSADVEVAQSIRRYPIRLTECYAVLVDVSKPVLTVVVDHSFPVQYLFGNIMALETI
jgi:hypothetical protein